MVAVTQFEVYVLEKGRWFLHARYSGEERRRAIIDARATERSTGLPSKVIRETTFPESEDSERVTTYISPQARARRRTENAVLPRTGMQPSPASRARPTSKSLTPTQIILRILVAAGFSLIAASVSLGVAYWVMQRMTAAGIEIPAPVMSNILTYGYVGLFLFFFSSMFRSRLALHRLLSDLWHTSATPAVAGPRVADTRPMRLKPKNQTTAPEKLKEWEELRVLRGDPDVMSAPEVTAPADEDVPANERDSAPAQRAVPETVSAASQAVPPTPKPEKAKTEHKPVEKAAPPATVDETSFAAVQLKRFVTDIVTPAAHTMPDDPVARRGISLLLNGAVIALAEQAKDSAESELLLAWSLKAAGLAAAAVDLFVAQRQLQQSLTVNQPLVAAGRAAMGDFLTGANVRDAVLAVLAAWRTPFGLPSVPNAPQQPDAMAAPLRQVFMLTEIRPSPISLEAFGDMFADGTDADRITAHNEHVRGALASFAGTEIKHTGKGIFAQFGTVETAIACAQAVQSTLASGSACALIASTEVYEDPALSSTLFLRAEAAVSGVEDGGLTIEPRLLSEFFTSDHTLDGPMPPPPAPDLSPVSVLSAS